MTWPKSAEQCAVDEAERLIVTGQEHPIKEKLCGLIKHYAATVPVNCPFCDRACVDTVQHAHCATILGLAQFRGISFREAEVQFYEDELVDQTEAKMRGEEYAELVPPPSMFDIEK